MPVRQPPGYHELREALAQPGCPLCRLVSRAVESYIDNLLYESANDVGVRARLRRSRGFCRVHAARVSRPGASLGIALIEQDVLGVLLDVLAAGEARGAAQLARDLGSQEPCPACQHEREMEHLYLEALLKSGPGSELGQAYTASAGLCLPHFRLALREARRPDVLAWLIKAQQGFWERLRGELAEFIRKNDYRFRGEGLGAEGDSWLRALAATAGQEGLTL